MIYDFLLLPFFLTFFSGKRREYGTGGTGKMRRKFCVVRERKKADIIRDEMILNATTTTLNKI